MTWGDLFGFLYDEERKLAAKYPRWNSLIKHGDLSDQYEDLVLENQEAVERAIRRFSKTNKWPKMTSPQAAVLRERMDFAIDLVQLFGQSAVHVPNLDSKPLQLEWLLIYAWDWSGFGNKAGTIENLHTGNILRPNPLVRDADGHHSGNI